MLIYAVLLTIMCYFVTGSSVLSLLQSAVLQTESSVLHADTGTSGCGCHGGYKQIIGFEGNTG